jgi:hypothetical protein
MEYLDDEMAGATTVARCSRVVCESRRSEGVPAREASFTGSRAKLGIVNGADGRFRFSEIGRRCQLPSSAIE